MEVGVLSLLIPTKIIYSSKHVYLGYTVGGVSDISLKVDFMPYMIFGENSSHKDFNCGKYILQILMGCLNDLNERGVFEFNGIIKEEMEKVKLEKFA